MATRAVLTVFEKYQKERVAFVSAVAEMAKTPQVSPGTHVCRPASETSGGLAKVTKTIIAVCVFRAAER